MGNDDAIVSDLLDLSGLTLAEMLDPPPELRAVLDAATDRVVRQILDQPPDGCGC